MTSVRALSSSNTLRGCWIRGVSLEPFSQAQIHSGPRKLFDCQGSPGAACDEPLLLTDMISLELMSSKKIENGRSNPRRTTRWWS